MGMDRYDMDINLEMDVVGWICEMYLAGKREGEQEVGIRRDWIEGTMGSDSDSDSDSDSGSDSVFFWSWRQLDCGSGLPVCDWVLKVAGVVLEW
jgi:hypothetical protein